VKPITRALMLSGLAALSLAAGVATWIGQRQTRWMLTDGADVRVEKDSAQARQILWKPPAAIGPPIETQADEYEPRLSADGQTLFFVRGKPGENADIFWCLRTSAPVENWSDPQPLADINTDSDELGPAVSPDGSTLYFCSNRAGGAGGYDLWRSMRTENGWGTPENLGPDINTGWNEHNPSLAPDGLNLFFASNRPRPDDITNGDDPSKRWSATVRDNVRAHDFDLYSSSISNSEISQPAALTALNTSANEGTPSMSPAGDVLYFSSDRSNGQGGFDLYRSRLLRGEWLAPENIGLQINSAANELDPSLSMGGFALHFSSDRRPESHDAEARPQYDLFSSISKEVFEEREYAGDAINWASLLATVLPNLLWLLLGLLLVLLFLKFVRSGKMSALSLLTRCILLSLLAHVLLMMLFMIWGVTVGLADAIKRGGSMQVGLVSSSVGQGQGQSIASQIRGELTDAAMTPVGPTSEKQSLSAAPEDVAIIGVRIVDQHQPVQVAERVDLPSESNNDAPAPAERLTMSAAVEVPADQAQSIQTRIPSAVAANVVSEAESKAPGSQISSAARSETRIRVDSPQDASIQTPSGQLSNAALERSAGEGSMAGPLEARDVTPTGDSMSLPSTAVVVATPVPMTDVSLPRAERRGGGGSATEAQATISAAAISAGRATDTPAPDRADSSDGNGHGSAMVLTGSPSPVAVDGGASLASSLSMGAADAAPSSTTASAMSTNEVGSTIGAPATEQSGVLPGMRTPADSAGSPTRTASNESQVQLGADGGGPTNQSGKVDSPLGPDASSSTGGPVVTNTPGTLGSGAPLGDDKRSLVSSNLSGALSDALEPSTLGFSGTDSSASIIPALPGDSSGIRLPTETAPPADVYRQRAAENRLDLVKEKGGSEATERAVELALKWLAAHQSADGRWDADHFDDDCGRCGNPARFDADVATTGLALLCFMAANHTHAHDGPYRSQVQRGLDWLVNQQRESGDLRGNETMYSHGIGSIALSEAYGMTHDQALLPYVHRAINYIVKARDTSGRDGPPASGGWRYEPGQAGDTSVLGWQVMAMVSASRAGVDVPDDALAAARRWLDRVSTPANPGLYSYQPGERFSVSMTAEGMFSQQLLGQGRDEPRMQNSAEFITRTLPNWRSEPNTYYWYYATLALYQHQGPSWEKWNAAITKQLLDNQHTSGARAGSWDPLDRWSKIGGRVYQTALCTLCLEVYYRYLPLSAPHEAAVEQVP
jgi:hypothetical protein